MRRETYGAALQQFDDLMTAAAAIGPVSRPLPLYYAVLQAGKAIAAAWAPGDTWRVEGHGLAEDRQAEWQDDILRFRVKPSVTKRGPGVFGAVASKLGTARLTGSVELGALWSAFPGAHPPASGSWPLALPVQPTYFDHARHLAIRVRHGYVFLRAQVPHEHAESISQMLAMYPDAVGARVDAGSVMLPVSAEDEWGVGVEVTWPEFSSELVPPYPYARIPQRGQASHHWLVPAVGEGADRLSPLLLWWALLFGLSLLARYHPAEWRAALDLDRSHCADRLMELLDEALLIVPDLLYEATAWE
jgi:hypothetical protein